MAASDLRQYLRTVFAICERKDTGVLTVSSADERALLYFRTGVVIHVEQTRLGRTLGAHLIDQGTITRDQYAVLAEKIARLRPETPLIAFVENAIALGFIEPSQAAAIVGGQVERNFVRCFAWTIESAGFTATETSLDGQPINPCSPHELALLGLRRHTSREELASIFSAYRDRCPRLSAPVDQLAGEFRLQPFEARYLRQMDDDVALGELMKGENALDDQLLALLVALYLSRRLKLVTQSGVTRAAVDESPRVKVKPKLSLDGVRLSLPRAPSQEEFDAAGAFLRGKRLARIDPAAAKPHLDLAVDLHPRPDYVLYQSWVDHALGSDEDEDPHLERRLESTVQEALEHDPTNAFAYCVVGQMHLALGDEASALLAFRRGRKLDPSLGAVIREMQRRAERQ